MAAGFQVIDPAETMAAQRGSTRTIAWLLAAIASISLVVGGISIMNIMLVSVAERTREIGLRLALGARQRDISRLFLIEALLVCILGGILGAALGVAASWTVARLAGWPILIAPETFLAALAFAAAVGLVFGYYPARKAARLLPASALRSE
jgi:putative ABC transport system permease protein